MRRKAPAAVRPRRALLVAAARPPPADGGRPERPRPAPERNGACTFPIEAADQGRPWSLQRIVLDRAVAGHQGGRKGVRSGSRSSTPAWTHATPSSPRPSTPRRPRTSSPARTTTATDRGGTTDGTDEHGRPRHQGRRHHRGPPAQGHRLRRPGPRGHDHPDPPERREGHRQRRARWPRPSGHAVAAGADVINISQDTARRRVPPARELDQAVSEAIDARTSSWSPRPATTASDGKRQEDLPGGVPGRPRRRRLRPQQRARPLLPVRRLRRRRRPGRRHGLHRPRGRPLRRQRHQLLGPVRRRRRGPAPGQAPATGASTQIVAQIEQTAERSVNGRDGFVGWGVVDPVRALTEDDRPLDHARADDGPPRAAPPDPVTPVDGETPQKRMERYATYGLGSGGVAVAVIAGVAVIRRDIRRRTAASAAGTATAPRASQ